MLNIHGMRKKNTKRVDYIKPEKALKCVIHVIYNHIAQAGYNMHTLLNCFFLKTTLSSEHFCVQS